MPVNSYCWSGTVAKFMRTGKDAWLSEMSKRYKRVMPHDLTPGIIKSWENCWDVLAHTFLDLGRSYNGLNLIFEYGLPMRPVKKGNPFDPAYAMYVDCIVLSDNTVAILEFKDKALAESPEFSRNLSYSVRKYRNRIQENHDMSRGLNKKGVLISTIDHGVKKQRIRGIDLCSADMLKDELLDIFGTEPGHFPDIRKWRASSYT